MAAIAKRYAVYYAPANGSALWIKGSTWIGRDAVTGTALAQPPAPGVRDPMQALTTKARRYGFHATLKAPMALKIGHDGRALCGAVAEFAKEQRPVEIGPVELRLMDNFLAIVPRKPSAALTSFASEVVTRLDHFREPISQSERNKRLGEGLTPRQIELLDRYGYPLVLEEFQFHMTLTDRIAGPDREPLVAIAQQFFTPEIDGNLVLDRLAVFEEAGVGANFMRIADFELRGAVR
jgi:putative phosphonate metabolism protein